MRKTKLLALVLSTSILLSEAPLASVMAMEPVVDIQNEVAEQDVSAREAKETEVEQTEAEEENTETEAADETVNNETVEENTETETADETGNNETEEENTETEAADETEEREKDADTSDDVQNETEEAEKSDETADDTYVVEEESDEQETEEARNVEDEVQEVPTEDREDVREEATGEPPAIDDSDRAGIGAEGIAEGNGAVNTDDGSKTADDTLQSDSGNGLAVAYHSQQEIKDFIRQSSENASYKITYQKTPNTKKGSYDPGRLSENTQSSAIALLNQVRYVAGIPYNVTLNEDYEAAAQAGSLVNYVNKKLSHYPEKPDGMDEELYQLGYKGQSSSNIAWASWSDLTMDYVILDMWMADDDSSNIDRVGHRRWLLNPTMGQTGFGAVTGTNGTYSSVYAFDRSNQCDVTRVAWPAQNMPVTFFHKDYPWSVSMGEYIDKASVSVKMTQKSNGKVWHFSADSADGFFNVNNGGYGQTGCIIFRPDNITAFKHGDVFDVDISYGDKSISYTVNFFALNKVGSEPEPDPEPEPTVKLDPPEASPASGSVVRKGTKITLTTNEPGATIKYYLGTGIAKDRYRTYKEPIEIGEDTTISTYASKAGMSDSDIVEYVYFIGKCKVTFDSKGGTPIKEETVEMGERVSEPDEPVKAGFRFDGWYLNGEKYDFNRSVEEDIVLEAKWTEEEVLSVPTASVSAGDIEKDTGVWLRHTNRNAVIRYTLDGTNPTLTSGKVYNGPIFISEDTTIKAFATAEGYKDSTVAEFIYTVKEKHSMWGDVEPEDIPEGGIPNGIWIAGIQDEVYTGTAIKPSVRVYDGNRLLREREDYTITYRNNTKAASASGVNDTANAKRYKTPTVIITGKGCYSSKLEKYFTIYKKNMEDEDVLSSDIVCQYVKNKVQKPAPVLMYQGRKLTLEKDFTVSYTDTSQGAYKEPGIYEVNISGKGNFEGNRTVRLVITEKKPVDKMVIKKIENQSFTGEAIKPVPDIRYGGKLLVEGVDYTIRYENNVSCGQACVVICGRNGFYGTRRVGFKIVEAYRIGKYDISTDKYDVMDYQMESVNEYKKGGCKPEIKVFCDGKKLTRDIDYTVVYRYFSKAEDVAKSPMVVIKGKGNFTGKHGISYQIQKKDITDMNSESGKNGMLFAAADKVYNLKKGGYKTKVIVYDRNGTALKPGVDYDKNIEYRYKNDTVLADGEVRKAGLSVEKDDIMQIGTELTVTIHGINNYTGSCTAEYRLIDRKSDISSATAKVKASMGLQYTGENICITESDMEVTFKGDTLSSQNYRIAGYRNNVKKGTAEVIIVGKGTYGGMKTVKFPIGARKLNL